MPFARRETALAWLALGALLAPGVLLAPAAARAQYSTPVGTGAAKPKTLRATAVLEWTGSLEKPNASRLMPVAVWDGERYQPAGLYLAQPAPLAFETGTQYVLERMGEPAGLFNVRGAAQLNGDWVGMGKYQAETVAAPAKLKVSKQLPILSNGRPEKPDTGDSGRPTLHRKGADSSGSGDTSDGKAGTAESTPAKAPASSTPASQPAETSDSDRPTLHKRSSSDDSTTSQGTSSTTPAGTSSPSKTDSTSSTDSGSASTGSTTSSGSTGSSTGGTSSSDSDRPTLHKRSSGDDSGSGGSSTSGGSAPDAPTLHKHTDAASPDVDPDRPTLHRGKSSSSAGLVTTSGNIDPDRPHLRYGKPDATEASMLPAKLEGAPAAMQQMVAVSDVATGEPHSYKYQWASPDDAAKIEDALATAAAQLAVQALNATHAAASHPAAGSTRSTHSTARATKPTAPALPAMAEANFKAFELSYSGGATVVYSAHTADEGSRRVYVTLIAQPDFYGQPQILFKQVARGDRLDATPALQLVDAVDTDDDGRAELIFQLNGGSATLVAQATPPGTAASVGAPSSEREFAIYKVANGHADQVFTTGPLP